MSGIASVTSTQGLPGYGMHKFNEGRNGQIKKASLARKVLGAQKKETYSNKKITNPQVKQLVADVERTKAEAEKAQAILEETNRAINEIQQLQPTTPSEKKYIDAMYAIIRNKTIIGALKSFLPWYEFALKLSYEVRQSCSNDVYTYQNLSKFTFGLISANNSIRKYESACADVKDCESNRAECLKDIEEAEREYGFAKAKFAQLKKQYPALAKKYADLERRLHL